MESSSKRSAVVVVLALLALTISSLPSFGAPASQHYQVATSPNSVQAGKSLKITATIKQASPDCTYAVLLDVTGPGGVSATNTIAVHTEEGGNGHASVSFPDNFLGTANTNTAGTYTVSATFTCNYYSTGAASTTFTVTALGQAHYQVNAVKKVVQSGQSVMVIAAAIRAIPDCTYSVVLAVSGPGGVSATDTVTLNTEDGGNGIASASFPSDFSGTANTNTPGTYTVSATFTCGYATGADTNTFKVTGPGEQAYQVAAVKSNVLSGHSVRIAASTVDAVPGCAYSVLLDVTGPKGVSATDTVTINTGSDGNGHAAASFPDDFSGTANTNTAGTYTVSATFTCGYATGAASTVFTVVK